MQTLKIELTITKDGVLLEDGTPATSPFVFKGHTTLIDAPNGGVGFIGSFYTDLASETPIVLKNVKDFVFRRTRKYDGITIGGMVSATNIVTVSEDKLNYTIDEALVKDGVRVKLAAILGILTTDIS